ncbi:MAG: hypothetical protein RMK29_00575 [Myxococcales bacterium]|nr:hypothetical protein [Myxococcota bacterium]MDW8280171.1 hypothetical protein [Myxococcales bacterium]
MRPFALHVLVALLLLGPPPLADAARCKRGKKPCGDRCIPASKACVEDPGPQEPGGTQTLSCKRGKKPCGDRCIPASKACVEPTTPAAPTPEPKLASASSTEVAAAFKSQAGQAMLQLARALLKSGELDVDETMRLSFRQGLRGIQPPLPICNIGHVQLVRDCDAAIGASVTLPCYLAVDEMAEVCKLLGQPMPTVK